MRHPVVLLLLVGCLLAISINVAKAASAAGASPLLTAFAATGGAGLVLLARAALSREVISLQPGRLAFYMGAGALSYAFPNALVFAAASHVGSGYAAILHAFVPGLTYVVALAWGLDRLSGIRSLGVAFGLIGALVVIVARLGFSAPEQTFWVLLALAAPVSIALGNVVRSRFWPAGATPGALAPALLLAAGLQLGIALLMQPTAASPPVGSVRLLLFQALVSAIFYHLYFRLQHLAGPVYLSQIGYVAAGFGLPLAAFLFDERITLPMLGGVTFVALGVLLVKPAQQKDQSRTETERAPGAPLDGGAAKPRSL
jgi:drug/metabolite transporter (DMT)-like permease